MATPSSLRSPDLLIRDAIPLANFSPLANGIALGLDHPAKPSWIGCGLRSGGFFQPGLTTLSRFGSRGKRFQWAYLYAPLSLPKRGCKSEGRHERESGCKPCPMVTICLPCPLSQRYKRRFKFSLVKFLFCFPFLQSILWHYPYFCILFVSSHLVISVFHQTHPLVLPLLHTL
jgi:hypothetical protein